MTAWIKRRTSVVRDFDFVVELYTSDDLRQLILSLQAPPAFRGRHDQLEHHKACVSCDSAPFIRTVRCRTVAKALSIGLMSETCPVLGRKIEERQQRVAVLEQAIDGLVVFGRIFLGEDCHRGVGGRAALGKPDFAQIPMRVGLTDFGSLSSTFRVLCCQQRW